ncbi:MAG: NAD+ synthase [Candidatus Thermoplasmatota archaeon]|nr:NAD+ synthase [Candidatus Thermoplasmatota archaeon]
MILKIENRAKEQKDVIVHFLRSFDKPFIVGMSGGLDSSVVAALCSEAGKARALIMPDSVTSEQSTKDAVELANKLGVEHELMNIDNAVKALGLFKTKISEANAKARARMCLLYRRANEEDCFVVGTSNKSEIMMGYSTKFGDGASDILPIGDLYKTEVRFLARELSIPEAIIKKVPSAELYPGQTDEGELGMDYETLDLILKGLELQVNDDGIAGALNMPVARIERVREMVECSRHKRRAPYILKLGVRTPWIDWL